MRLTAPASALSATATMPAPALVSGPVPATTTLLPGWEVAALRDYQADAVQIGVAHFQEHARGQLVKGCGTGKTKTFLHLAHELLAAQHAARVAAGQPVAEAPVVLIVAPTRELVEQTARVIARFHAGDPRGAPTLTLVASDDTIGKRVRATSAAAARRATTPGEQLGVPTLHHGGHAGALAPVGQTTDTAALKTALRTADAAAQAAALEPALAALPPRPHYVLSTLASIEKARDMLRRQGAARKVAVLVVDEAHRTCGESAERGSRVVLTDEIRAEARLFVTATPPERPLPPPITSGRARSYPLAGDDQAVLGLARLALVPLLDDATDRAVWRGVADMALSRGLTDGGVLVVRGLTRKLTTQWSAPGAGDYHEVTYLPPGATQAAALPALMTPYGGGAVSARLEDPAGGPLAGALGAGASSVLVRTREEAERLVAALTAVDVAHQQTPGATVAPPSASRPLAQLVRELGARATRYDYMDDRATYGQTIAHVPSAHVRKAGHLAESRVLLTAVDATEVSAVAARAAALSGSVSPGARPLAADDCREIAASALALVRAARVQDFRNTVLFAADIQQADTLAALLADPFFVAMACPAGDAPAITATPIHSEVPDKVRGARREAFAVPAPKGALHVVTSVCMGTEGQDLPSLDTAGLASLRASDVTLTQIEGRTSRPGRAGKVGTLFLPVVVDAVGAHASLATDTAAALVEERSREIVLAAARGLAVHDESVARRIETDTLTALPRTGDPARDEAAREAGGQAVRALAFAASEAATAVSPARYDGVSFDGKAPTRDYPVGRHRAQLAAEVPGQRTPGALKLLDVHAPSASAAALAVDRARDEHGLAHGEHALRRNFARPLGPVADSGAATDRYVRPVLGAAGRASVAGAPVPTHVAEVVLRSCGGRKANAVAVRYAASEAEAHLVADALVARYDGQKRDARHDLTLRPVADAADRALAGATGGVEYDAAAGAWWAYARRESAEGPTVTPLGFYASQAAAEAAHAAVQPAVAALATRADLATAGRDAVAHELRGAVQKALRIHPEHRPLRAADARVALAAATRPATADVQAVQDAPRRVQATQAAVEGPVDGPVEAPVEAPRRRGVRQGPGETA